LFCTSVAALAMPKGVTGAAEGAGAPELEASWQAKSRRVAARADEGARKRGGCMEAKTIPKHSSTAPPGQDLFAG
jgi:hypothetical protein